MKKIITLSKRNWDAILILGLPVTVLVIAVISFAVKYGANPIGV